MYPKTFDDLIYEFQKLPIGTALIVMLLDRRPIKPMLKGLACYPLFMGSWLLINFKCLFKRETTWEKINHVRNIKIGDVEETENTEIEEIAEKV